MNQQYPISWLLPLEYSWDLGSSLQKLYNFTILSTILKKLLYPRLSDLLVNSMFAFPCMFRIIMALEPGSTALVLS